MQHNNPRSRKQMTLIHHGQPDFCDSLNGLDSLPYSRIGRMDSEWPIPVYAF